MTQLINEIKQVAAQIRKEKKLRANTAERIGGILENIALELSSKSDTTEVYNKVQADTIHKEFTDGITELNRIFAAHDRPEIHKTSEQVRAEIIDANIPATIARLQDIINRINAVVGGADANYNTLAKLQAQIEAIRGILDGDNGDNLIETLQEALNFINNHKTQIESLVNTYVKKSDVIDNLTTDDGNKVLSARQGKKLQDAKLATTGDVRDNIVTFSAAGSRVNISSGEKMTLIFGKVFKWFNDLGTLAFKSAVGKTDLDNALQTEINGKQPAGYYATSAQGTKADNAVQSAKVGTKQVPKNGTELVFPEITNETGASILAKLNTLPNLSINVPIYAVQGVILGPPPPTTVTTPTTTTTPTPTTKP